MKSELSGQEKKLIERNITSLQQEAAYHQYQAKLHMQRYYELQNQLDKLFHVLQLAEYADPPIIVIRKPT